MARDRLLTAEEFLTLRHKLTEDTNTSVLEGLHNELASMIVSDPDRAASILQALTDSSDTADRDTAAIYISLLFTTRPDHARELLVTLLHDTDHNVRAHALDTLDIVTSDNRITVTEAARLATSSQN